MTCVIFAVSGLRHRKLAADDDVDMLVILTACYFHDIVTPGEKIIRNGSVLQSWRQKRRVACSVKSSRNFRRRKLRPFVMPLPLTVSARKSPP
ncbi:putative phosphohydrolase [Escherichia coli]|uniref:Putative phosphohydrolase n=1 Tax=Escherichia coli TaxID=562 RepID=A0A376LN92_ECOLX|nr:putative phosphohydrolase [Escherichia coli]